MPPRNIGITNITNTTAVVVWDPDRPVFSYSISITSSCPSGHMLITGVRGSNYTIQDLCPYNNYTIVLRTDAPLNMSSPFSNIVQFSTLTGIPSEPRFVTGMIDQERKLLIVTWIIPIELNGDINKYEVRWSTTTTALCTDNSMEVEMSSTDNASSFQFIQSIQTLNVKSYSVCVRASTTGGRFGLWGIHSVPFVNQGGLTASSTDDCNTLTTVAIVAAITVISSLVMSIILLVSVIQKGWFCLKPKGDGDKKKFHQ